MKCFCEIGGENFPARFGDTSSAIYNWNRRADLARPKVKPLVWGRAEKPGMNLQADCPFGRYYIALRGEYGWLWWRPASGPAHMDIEQREEDAKAAAQADYERRVLEALE